MYGSSQLQNLLSTGLFSQPPHSLSYSQRSLLSYQRAKAIAACSSIDVEDILHLREKFWDLHTHPILCADGAATTLLTIQYNLVAGTIASYLGDGHRQDLVDVINDLLAYRCIGQMMLTEVGHGLDAGNLETTATYLPSGQFDLHSPSPAAAKHMPPTIPMGIPCIAVVFARLIVDGEYRGIRPFLVHLNDGKSMSPGVYAKLLPPRGGPNPVNHSLTRFNHVRLPKSALLGSMDSSAFPHMEFLQSIWRVAVGSAALACSALPTIEIYATIGATYSLRRKVGVPPTPIWQFRTQQRPVLVAVAQAFVLRALRNWVVQRFSDEDEDPRVRHGIAACFKAVMVQHSQASCLAISERCGAQGLFGVNQMSTLHSEMRGIAIAEGDLLGLSIRLNTELLLNRYALPPSADHTSLLARHELGLFEEQRKILATLENHRSPEFNRLLLPRSQFMVESIGHRMAFDAAVAAGVDSDLVMLYLADVIRQDSSWYALHAGLDREAQFNMEDKAIEALAPQLETLIETIGVQPYVTAPICSQSSWNAFVDSLEEFRPAELSTQGIKARL